MRTFAFAALLSVPVALAMQACSSDDENPPAISPQPDAGPDVAVDAPVMRTTGLPQTCQRGERVREIPATCNGSTALCSRTYDRVAVPMTHNAYSLVSGHFSPPNQTEGIANQLEDGIRGMMLDTAYFDPIEKQDSTERIVDLSLPDQTFLCHGFCSFAQTRLLDELCTITKFLDAHPGEVVSIIFENRIADADTAAMLQASGLADYVYTHESTTAPWPTLGDMIASGKRAVIFLEQNGGTPAYLHPAWTNVWDTPYSFASTTDFSCRLNRGATTNPLFLVNHWLSPPKPENGDQVNVESVLGKRVEQCTQEAGRVPTFVGVDWYDKGNLFDVVRKANGL
ncbi:hypothetical protein LZC95_46405 [Pendulispora brunnea]|uniref:PLC-like phosphodiesterase n=1 Tax=Pendulispora brunnea TaxID=2905690 RepID=A0ABZ2K9T5_9BACT